MKRLGYIVQIFAVVGFVVNLAFGLAGNTVMEIWASFVSAAALFIVGRVTIGQLTIAGPFHKAVTQAHERRRDERTDELGSGSMSGGNEDLYERVDVTEKRTKRWRFWSLAVLLAIVAVSFGPDWIESIGIRTGWWGTNMIVSGAVESINDRAPIQIDDAVVAVGSSVEPENTIKINWQITTWSRDQLDLVETERVIREQYVAQLIANSMEDETAAMLERHSIRYQYSVSDRNGDHLFDIFIDEF